MITFTLSFSLHLRRWEALGERRCPNEVLRVHAEARHTGHGSDVTDAVRRCSAAPGCFPTVAEVRSKRVVVSTLATAGKLYGIGVGRGDFAVIVVDEAGQVASLSLCVC